MPARLSIGQSLNELQFDTSNAQAAEAIEYLGEPLPLDHTCNSDPKQRCALRSNPYDLNEQFVHDLLLHRQSRCLL